MSMVLIRVKGGDWHEPHTSAYANEKELQDLVKLSPTLLPGGDALAVVDEFWVPGIGSADLVAVGLGGEIVIVECKLQSNPEIRREVIGQTLAYAGGLWRMTYDEFAVTFANRAGISLHAAVAAASKADVDEVELREAVARRLSAGEFTLIIAVDSITSELRLIIEYLNEHSLANVHVLAVELAYGRDADVELLIPTVYGAEQKPSGGSTAGARWNAATFAEQIETRTSGPVRAFLEKLLEHGEQKGHHPYYGSGKTPGMSYYYGIGGHVVSVWALYLHQPVPRAAVSLGAIAVRDPERASALLQRLRADPLLANALSGVGSSVQGKYPQFAVDPVLVDPAAQAAFLAALDCLVSEPSPTSQS